MTQTCCFAKEAILEAKTSIPYVIVSFDPPSLLLEIASNPACTSALALSIQRRVSEKLQWERTRKNNTYVGEEFKESWGSNGDIVGNQLLSLNAEITGRTSKQLHSNRGS
jgi:hypothetical protein